MVGLPNTLDVDTDGYPSKERLKQITEADTIGTGARWMVETFPQLANSIPFAVCDVLDDEKFGRPIKLIEFHSQGWSGCEDFIEAVLANTMIRTCYYWAWRRGGYHAFEVSLSELT